MESQREMLRGRLLHRIRSSRSGGFKKQLVVVYCGHTHSGAKVQLLEDSETHNAAEGPNRKLKRSVDLSKAKIDDADPYSFVVEPHPFASTRRNNFSFLITVQNVVHEFCTDSEIENNYWMRLLGLLVMFPYSVIPEEPKSNPIKQSLHAKQDPSWYGADSVWTVYILPEEVGSRCHIIGTNIVTLTSRVPDRSIGKIDIINPADPHNPIVSWDRDKLRRTGIMGNLVFLEIGRRCEGGPGLVWMYAGFNEAQAFRETLHRFLFEGDGKAVSILTHRTEYFGVSPRHLEGPPVRLDKHPSIRRNALRDFAGKAKQQVDKESRQIFDDALRDGWVESQTTKVLITGIAGSGKTSSKHVLFEDEQPKVRQSTPMTEQPIRATRVDKKSSKWIRVGTKKMLKLLAIAMRYYAIIRPKELRSSLERGATSSPTPSQTFQDDSSSGSLEDMFSLDEDIEVSSTVQPAVSSSVDGSEALERSSQTEDDLLDLLKGIPPSEMVDQMDFVQFIDSGGQPQFLEIMPALLTGNLFCIFVIKLCEKLDEYPTVECYDEKGKLVGQPYRAALTNEEFLKQGITTMLSRESRAGEGNRQRILIIGTHKDREDECLDNETSEDKNEKLREVLLPFTDDIIYYGSSLKHLIFPLNARSPTEEDHLVAEKIRRVIAQCSPEPVRIPIRWYCFELRVKELAENERRNVLSTEECFRIARRLHFDEKSFLAALEFLHRLSSISYFREFLQGVVFSDPQVLVDIVSEVVEALHKLTEGTGSEGFEGDWRKMRDYGIVTIERLKSFKQHRIPGLFTYREVTELFKALLILAVFDESSYFMPCLLKRLHIAKVASHRSDSSNVAPLLIHFPQGPRCGVFCSLMVFLLSSDNQSPGPWQLTKTREDVPRCLYRNCVEFFVPGYPATITLIDSFSFFEAYILIRPELCKEFCSELCPLVRDALLDGVEKARQTLHYSNWEAKLAFFCPCSAGSLHRADLSTNQGSWICSNDQLECGRLKDKHRLWISLDPVPRPHPVGGACSQFGRLGCDDLFAVLKELVTVYAEWENIGLSLKLSPGTLDAMKGPYKPHKDCMRDMLKTWLNTSTDPSWKDLAEALTSPLVGQDALARDLATKYCF